jgi:hypothetical protein
MHETTPATIAAHDNAPPLARSFCHQNCTHDDGLASTVDFINGLDNCRNLPTPMTFKDNLA